MTKPKAQTLQQKLGFFDDDIKKPKHDELMLWLDSNIERIVNELFSKPYSEQEKAAFIDLANTNIKSVLDWLNKSLESCNDELKKTPFARQQMPPACRRTDSEISESILNLEMQITFLKNYKINIHLPEKPKITKIKKTWELPVTTNSYSSKFTIGFIDFTAFFNIPVLEFLGLKYLKDKDHPNKRDYFNFEEKELGFNYIPEPRAIYIEVKTEINSLGDLIRQINQYKTYLAGDYYVLCPDNKYKNLLQEQGIKFIEQL